MALSRTALTYGAWFTLAGIIVTAIWIMPGRYVEQDQWSQIFLAVHERCLATQTAQGSNVVQVVTNIVIGYTNDPSGKTYATGWNTNGVATSTAPYLVRTTNSEISTVTTEMGFAYSVAPLFQATPMTWAPGKYITGYTTNSDGSIYTNDGLLFLTNSWTNTIGWYVDGAMVDAAQDKIRALIPYYLNTNNYPTSLVAWTATGLFSNLFGRTNTDFTMFPGSTNTVTNYWIIYTNWPATVVSYSSTVGQVCNVQVGSGVYSNMEFTSAAHVVVATITNDPVWFNGNYVTTNTLVEMAKMLAALRDTINYEKVFERHEYFSIWAGYKPWDDATNDADAIYFTMNPVTRYSSVTNHAMKAETYGEGSTNAASSNVFAAVICVGSAGYPPLDDVVTRVKSSASNVCNKIFHDNKFDVFPFIPDSVFILGDPSLGNYPLNPTNSLFDDNGLGVSTGQWNNVWSSLNHTEVVDMPFWGVPTNTVPVWCDKPTVVTTNTTSNYGRKISYRGFRALSRERIYWHFQYCTNAIP